MLIQEIKTHTIANTMRLTVFPILLSTLSLLIWMGILKLQTDVDTLLADNNTQKQQILILESQIKSLNRTVYKMSYSPSLNIKELDLTQNVDFKSFLFASIIIQPMKHEEIFNIRKHIKLL